jgi:hypothetical protein
MRTWAKVLVVATTVAGLIPAFALADWSGALGFAAFAGIGAYLVIQRPRNSVGWFLMLIGWGLAIGSARLTAPLDALATGRLDGLEAFTAWASGVGWVLVLVGFFGITAVFPTGNLPEGHARWLSRIGFAGLISLTALLAFGPIINVTPAGTGISVDLPNPAAILPDASFWTLVPEPGLLFTAMFGIVLAGVIGLIRRSNRSVGLERLQYRWLVAAISFAVIANGIWAVATFPFQLDANGPAWLLLVVAYLTVPIAIAVAVLRYRLYEIDRIVSRSIAYVVVSAVLLAVFGAAILMLSAALSSVAGGKSIAVAASTLVAYAACQPVLGRVRRTVDRRFDRARYDGERTATVFAARVRDETDVKAVIDDLAATSRSVVAPISLTVWLRPRDMPR